MQLFKKLNSIQETNVQPITIIVTDVNKQWIDGLFEEVYWGWVVELHDFWFSKEY
ncbi:hypothetical protein [Lysinibacillus endophyticus]|uniref:hypothetical protein n=1 Tax=Ureibacillus endophyticus TaxID=1978490 RepID=UPI00209F5466|nr:hypothetical protein [Lysinibacillus endophyticus]MCP1146807.1 hypothetical protein [Lysinibacillus endophyticus]